MEYGNGNLRSRGMSLEVDGSTWFKDAALDGIVSSTITEISGVAFVMFGAFVALKFGYMYFQYSLNSLNDSNYAAKWWDWNEVVRNLALFMLLSIYPALAPSVSGGIREVTGTMDRSSSTRDKMEVISNEVYLRQTIMPQMEKVRQAKRNLEAARESNSSQEIIKAAESIVKQEEKKLGSKVDSEDVSTDDFQEGEAIAEDSVWNLLFGGVANFVSIILNAIFGFIATLMKWIIGGYARVLFKLLLCFGPLAIAFSVFWRDKLLFWFESLLNVGFVFMTLNILDILINDYFYHAVYSGDAGIGETLAFNLATIGAYMTAFKITGYFIGRTGANSMMNKSIGVIGTLAAGALLAGGSMVGGAAKDKAGAAARGVNAASRTGSNSE